MKHAFSLLIILVLFGHFAHAQQTAPAMQDVTLKAMRDELNRNLKELRLPNLSAPFFILYGITDTRRYQVAATLGSLIESSETPSRIRSSSRVLVGDYFFNDESLEDDLFSSADARDINLPLEEDYDGIRRSFWSITDKVYRDAARHFAKHQETLKESGKALDDLPHRYFAKAAPVQLIQESKPYVFDRTLWENNIRRLSGLFRQHPAILNSAVILEFVQTTKYMVNSEGTLSKQPSSSAHLFIFGQSKNAQGQFSAQSKDYLVLTPDQLPSEAVLASEINKMIDNLDGNSNGVPKVTEAYNGPVLLMGEIVAHILQGALIQESEGLMANDNIPHLQGLQYDNDVNGLEGKMGKNIVSESMTVTARPHLKKFQGTDLLGSFDMDDEGIVPADQVTLIQSGVLKALMNNRTITQKGQTANGFYNGPGVIEVTMSMKDSEKVLKEKLMAAAKKEGLEFGMIVRETPVFGTVHVYRVDVATGKEELMRHASLKQIKLNDLKHILGSSTSYSAYNLSAGRGGSGEPLSFIVPDALLLEEMDIVPFRMPSLRQEEYVKNPLE